MKKVFSQPVNQKADHSFIWYCCHTSIIVFFVTFIAVFTHYWCWWSNSIPYPATKAQVSYTESNPPNLPVLNSISDNPDTSELRFIQIVDTGLRSPNFLSTHLDPDREYEVRIYCRNDANPDYNESGQSVATNVRLAIDLPSKYTASTKNRLENGYISFCDRIGAVIAYNDGQNDAPQLVSAYAEIFSDETLKLEYVPGSAKITSAGAVNNAQLSKQLFKPQGIMLGYDALDGKLPGGRDYACIITFRFRTSASTWNIFDALYDEYYRP